MNDETPNTGARERQHERAAHVEHILEATEAETQEQSYPANSDELAARYRRTEFELANETESLDDAFDRLADEYDEFPTPQAAREALTAEITRDERFDEAFTNEQ